MDELLKFPKKYAGTYAATKASQIRGELLTGG
jgi:hypothetical protein